MQFVKLAAKIKGTFFLPYSVDLFVVVIFCEHSTVYVLPGTQKQWNISAVIWHV